MANYPFSDQMGVLLSTIYWHQDKFCQRLCFLLPTCGSQGIPPLYPWSCSSLPPLAHSIWPTLQAKSNTEILTCKQGQKPTLLWAWLQFLRGEVYVVIHQKEHICYLTLDLKKRRTWAISKFWSAQSISPAICPQTCCLKNNPHTMEHFNPHN